MGSLERNKEQAVILNNAANKVASEKDGQNVNLDILVMQIGRANFNLGKGFDLKGLVSGIVLLNSASSELFQYSCRLLYRNS